MHVSFEVRLQIRDAAGRYAMLIRRNELERGNRVVIPFGGGIRVADGDSEGLGFTPDNTDLRFEIHPDRWPEMVDFFMQFTNERLYSEAWRELLEETCDERPLMTPAECASCAFVAVQKAWFTGKSVRHATFGEHTLYLIGVVTVVPSEMALMRLLGAPKRHVEFIDGKLLQEGGTTDQGSLVYPLYRYLV